MSENEDKAKKLKEIQERLAEIQGKTGEKSTPEKKEVSKKEVKKDVAQKSSPTPARQAEQKSDKPKIQQNISPASSTKTVDKKADEQIGSIKSQSLTQEEKNWRANKVKTEGVKSESPKQDKKPKIEKKGSKRNKLSLIYTVISLIVTLTIVGYLINAYVLNPDSEEIVTSQLPEEIIQEESQAETTTETEEIEEEAMSAGVAGDTEEEVMEIEEEEEVPQAEVPEERTEEAPPESTRRRAKAQSTEIAPSLPSGIIISYASNSTKDMAIKNVSTLKSKGFKAAYYYMPDKDANSPKLYKVYVGPYSDESQAMPDFKKVVDLNAKAFILRLN